MPGAFLAGCLLLAGITLLATAFVMQTILLEMVVWTVLLAGTGALLLAWGAWALRARLGVLLQWRQVEAALSTLGMIGVLIALAYLSVRYPFRFDLTEAGQHSLSAPTVAMLQRLEKPVHIVFFHDPLLRRTVELYELIAAQTPLVTLELYDPLLHPAQARGRGVQFAGTAVMSSEDRTLQVHGGSEVAIANGILRVSQGARQRICFLDGHGEADPFSLESHDHLEDSPGHTHGLGAQYVLHERHGIARARQALETMHYTVEKVALVRSADVLSGCAVLVVAGPKVPLLQTEVTAVQAYLLAGGNAFFMLDPFVRSGLEPVLLAYGVVLDETIVIDAVNHFWTDISSPTVTSYNRHQVTRDLPLTFYPGVRSLSPTSERIPGVAVTPLINSSTQSYAETTPDRAQFDAGSDLPGPRTLMVLVNRRPVAAGDAVAVSPERQDDSTAVRTGSPEGTPAMRTSRSRIAVVGDSDFATNSFFHLLGNGTLFLNTVHYLTAQENLIGLEPRSEHLPRVNLTHRQLKGTFVLAVFLLPALLAVVGTAVWWRQR
jgi:ABC-type uncharacterized transport system involved in gliding motility auxiliary subunit